MSQALALPGTVLVLASLSSTLTAQQPIAAPAFLPLTEGTTWRYRVNVPDDPAGALAARTGELVRTAEADFGLPDGRRCTPVRVEHGGASTFEFWIADARTGVAQLAAVDPSRRGAIDLATAPRVHLSGNVAATQAVELPRLGTVHAARSAADPTTWFAPSIGIVREQRRDGAAVLDVELLAFTPGRDGRDDRERRLLAALEQTRRFDLTQSPPWIGWIDDCPEAALLPGRIAVVKNGAASGCFYVDGEAVVPFAPGDEDKLARAVTAAFGSPLPPADVPLEPLALLLARAHAERCHLGKVRAVAPTVAPADRVRGDARRALVEVVGGAPDERLRRVTVKLEVGSGRGNVRIDTDARGPDPREY